MTENDINCSICTDDLEIESKIFCIKYKKPIKTLNCNHQYHKYCINIWLKEHNTCPLCRKVVKHISVMDDEYRYTELNNYINKIKNNKNHKFYSILYILLLTGVITLITHIIILTSTINHIQ